MLINSTMQKLNADLNLRFQSNLSLGFLANYNIKPYLEQFVFYSVSILKLLDLDSNLNLINY